MKAAGQITLLYDSTDETAARTAAAVQDAWKQKLGLIAILRGATAQELADALNQGEFMVALTTVTADRGDASGLLSLWESGNGYFYSPPMTCCCGGGRLRPCGGPGRLSGGRRGHAGGGRAGSSPCTMSTVTAAWPSS